MARHGKAYRDALDKVDREREYSPGEAIALLKAFPERKMDDLNANDLDQAAKIIAGTARQMGITIEG